MKTVEKVSVGGYAFTMESEAAAAAAAYLGELQAFYAGKSSGAEILEGIEERMAELLMEKAPDGGVVTADMVAHVTETLGRPEAIEAEDTAGSPEAASEPAEPAEAPKTPRRRLYRDPSSRVVAGVCGGLGTFLNIDPFVFRLLFVIFSLTGFHFLRHNVVSLSAPFLYLIFWVCMPMARTVRQRDEQHGQVGTVDGISQRVRREAFAEPVTPSKPALSWISRLLGVATGVFSLLAGVAILAGVAAVVWASLRASGNMSYVYHRLLEEISVFGTDLSSVTSDPLVPLMVLIAVLLPAIGLIYAGVLLIFDLRPPRWHPGLWLFILWLVVLVVLAVFVVMLLVNGAIG